MYYKLYIDSVFVMQFIMNLYLLALAGKILGCTATHRRICSGALAGAFIACLLLILPVFSLYARLILSAVPVSMCMMYITFRIRKRLLFRSSLIVTGCGFFIGSIMIWILNRLRILLNDRAGLPATAVVGYAAYRILAFLIGRLQKKKTGDMRIVQIPVPGLNREVRVKALVDTGNHLSDPVSGKPVCIVSEKIARVIESSFLPEKYHAIPYSSVGKEKGMLDAYELPYVVLEESCQEVRKEQVIFAICNVGILEDSPYQMILHPRLLEN